MVLEDASTRPRSDSDPLTEPPPSDLDRYAGDTNPTYLPTRASNYITLNGPGPDQIHVNLSVLPRPFSLLGTRPQPPFLAQSIQEFASAASKVLNRPLTQPEADALAFHRANALSIASYGAPAGVTLGFAQAYRRRADFRFPGWTPGERFDPGSFGPVKGNAARALWHAARFNLYGAVGFLVGQVFFGTFAWTSLAAGQLKDPRLAGMMAELQKRSAGGSKGQRGEGGGDGAGARPGETFEMARQRESAAGGWRTRGSCAGAGREGDGDDDMSPTGGAFGREYGDGGVDTGLMSDEEIRRQVARQGSGSREASSGGVSTSGSSYSTASGRSSTQQRTRTEDSSSSADEKPAGGAWARLRQQAALGKQSGGNARSSDSGRDKDHSGSSDSFSFSDADEDRQLARSEAQRQFDARVEREREGKDFDDSRTNQRRW